MLDISLIFPVYNERQGLQQLYEEATDILATLKLGYQIIFVDDGSSDGSSETLRNIEKKDKKIIVGYLKKHCGKTFALRFGLQYACGNIILFMDSDLQDDPADIPFFIQKIKEGYDFVCGWRWDRKENIYKTILSRIFNIVVSLVTGLKLHDINCGIKAFKQEVLYDIELYSSLHRYIPVLAYLKGYKVTEIKVNHRKRKYGKSKYGVSRYFITLADLFRIIGKLFKKNEYKANF